MNNIDKSKIRTAIKCYLRFNYNATARQLTDFIESMNLGLRFKITPNILARELMYCSNNKNFLNIKFYKDNTNTCIYYLDKKEGK